MSRLRHTNIKKLGTQEHDVLIVGGGINGAVSAAALASRGVRVALVEERDFAGFTSQESSNLVWGGIKYLENHEFGLVWELCRARNELMQAYPANVREIRFFSAVEPGFRLHPWLMTLGSWLYWLMGRGQTKRPRLLTAGDLRRDEAAMAANRFRGGVEYSDAYLVDNDSRFVFGFVRSAINYGAAVANYVRLVDARRASDGGWEGEVRDQITGESHRVRAKVLVNAAGPFVDELNSVMGVETTHRHVFSRGVHLIVPQISSHERVLTFFDDTGRMFFVIPMGPRSVIGTTDTRVESPYAEVTDEDRDFLLSNANLRLSLERPLRREDIIAERCGVRPLVVSNKQAAADDDDWFNLSRKHEIEVGQNCLSLYGGKLTDCLNIGEEVVAHVASMGVTMEPSRDRWFGEPPDEARKIFFKQARYMRLDELREKSTYELLSTRLWRRYRLRAFSMLEAIREDPTMGELLIEGAQYIRVELHQAARSEMITKLEDFLRRRSKIALVVPHEEIAQAKGIREACAILFGDQAEEKYREYFGAKEQSAPAPVKKLAQ